jgi:TonB family protein
MSTVNYHYYMAELPWTPSGEDEQRYRKILLWILLIFLILSIVMPLLPVRERPKEEVVEVPPRLARIIEERKKPIPPPAKKLESKAKPEREQKKQRKPKKVKPKKKTVDTQVARKKAQSSGLLAFSDELAALRESPSLGKLSSRALKKGSSTTRKTTRSMVSASAGKGSGGINTASLSRDTGGAGLGGRQTTRVQGSGGTKGAGGAGGGKGKGRGASRDLEQIQITFDRNKGGIYAIYNRALRKDPSLQGKVVLKITISPSGKVTACNIISSELNDPKLERKLVQRVKMINFGAAKVAPFTFSYPIDFFPA